MISAEINKSEIMLELALSYVAIFKCVRLRSIFVRTYVRTNFIGGEPVETKGEWSFVRVRKTRGKLEVQLLGLHRGWSSTSLCTASYRYKSYMIPVARLVGQAWMVYSCKRWVLQYVSYSMYYMWVGAK